VYPEGWTDGGNGKLVGSFLGGVLGAAKISLLLFFGDKNYSLLLFFGDKNYVQHSTGIKS
jgi:hypothetical protein